MGPRIEVRQLRYAGAGAMAGRVEFAVADALRTEVVDDGRLVLVRSFPLGRIGFGNRAASLAAARAWRSIRESARHGGASGADSANCVWFRDLAEARLVLLRELAGGRRPLAWFWPLAVPDWQGEALGEWLARRLDEVADDASGETVAALVAEAQAAGCVAALTAAICARAAHSPATAIAAGAAGEAARHVAGAAREPAAPSLAAEDAAVEHLARAIANAVPAALRAALATLAGRAEHTAFVETLARGLALRMHPALALAPARLAVVAASVARILRSGGHRPVVAPAARTDAHGDERPAGPATPPRQRAPEVEHRRDPPPAEPMCSPEPVAAKQPAAATPLARVDPASAELPSAAAGVFLAITPLIRLGWREWLAAHPHLLLHQPGPRLLQRIAAHYRVPATDPLWGELPGADPAGEAPPELDAALRLWRAALDGWLRRKARLRLAEVVLRAGWIAPGDETTIVRFPLRAIEIRLRRLALDADPGWVDWLGRAYRVVYRDQPLLGPRLP